MFCIISMVLAKSLLQSLRGSQCCRFLPQMITSKLSLRYCRQCPNSLTNYPVQGPRRLTRPVFLGAARNFFYQYRRSRCIRPSPLGGRIWFPSKQSINIIYINEQKPLPLQTDFFGKHSIQKRQGCKKFISFSLLHLKGDGMILFYIIGLLLDMGISIFEQNEVRLISSEFISPNSASQCYVLGHQGCALSVMGTEVGVLKQADDCSFSRLLECQQGRCLETTHFLPSVFVLGEREAIQNSSNQVGGEVPFLWKGAFWMSKSLDF